jgi:hypothetical protein
VVKRKQHSAIDNQKISINSRQPFILHQKQSYCFVNIRVMNQSQKFRIQQYKIFSLIFQHPCNVLPIFFIYII